MANVIRDRQQPGRAALAFSILVLGSALAYFGILYFIAR